MVVLMITTSHLNVTQHRTGILNEDSTINNSATIERLAEIALSYARAGQFST